MSNDNKELLNLYSTIEDVLAEAKKANLKHIEEFNVNKRKLNKNYKGSIGQIIEEGVFHYPVNSRPEADFKNLGLELKVTGLKKLKNNHLVAKERLVLNIINYFSESTMDFEHSSFWQKNKLLLIMFYLYDYDIDDGNYLILDSFIHRFFPKDLEIIKSDRELIHKKIIEGQAHNISEADTMYLGACTKSENAEKGFVKQPFSPILARQRAYCLKKSYMDSFIEKVFENKTYEEIVSFEDLKASSFEYSFRSKFEKYFGRTEGDLLRLFNINKNAKSRFNLMCGKILGIKCSVNSSDEFKKANIELKTIRIEENNTIREHMSFPHFIYKEIVKQQREDSDIFNKFYSTKFMFVVFKKINGNYILANTVLRNMPYEDLNEYVKPVFEITKNAVFTGNIVREIKNGRFLTNFPTSKFNNVCHVRPHDTKSVQKTNKGLPLPIIDRLTGLDRYTKNCFWLDRRYILKVLKSKGAID